MKSRKARTFRFTITPLESFDMTPNEQTTHADGSDQASSHSMDRRQFLGAMALSAAGACFKSAVARAAEFPKAGDHSNMIVITAPTGDIGKQVLMNILASGARIRVIARDPSRLPTHVIDRVEVVQGSHGAAEVVDQAFKGADTVFWLCPPDPRAPSVEAAFLDFTRPACEAIRKHGISRVVGISALGRGLTIAKHAGYVTASLAMDDMIAATGASFRALTMPSFIDNLERQAQSIRNQGRFFGPIDGDRKLPAVATRDIAAVAARLLIDATWSGRKEAPVLGPEDLSFNDMARVMSEVLEKPVRYTQISFDAYKAGFVQRGMSEAMAQAMTDMARAKNNGLDNAQRRTSEFTTPTSFRQWCAEELKPLAG